MPCQVRTISLDRAIKSLHSSRGHVQYVLDPRIRSEVRQALARHLGLNIPPAVDGAV
ncbi:MAG: hypothetical protein ACRDFX_11945 [Chloroflexota bacterium]